MSEYLSTDDAHGRDTVDQEITLPNGKDTKIKVEVAPLEEIERFEEVENEGGDELELVQEVFDEYVVKPDGLNVHKMGKPKMESIMRGVFIAWGVAESEVDELIEDRQGN